MVFEKADFDRLFNLLRGAARVGFDYTFIHSDHEVIVHFDGWFLDEGFDGYFKELMGLSLYKWSSVDNRTIVFANPYNL